MNDLSQIYSLVFENPVPIDEVVNTVKLSPNVEYAEGPIVAYLTTSPNDPWYLDNNYRWSFDVIDAEGAWDITTGSQLIGVGMHDLFGGVSELHQDLIGKVVWDNLNGNYGAHGTLTAGVAGALTNNGTDIASLGWNIKLLLSPWSTNNIYELVNNGADVINFSWVSGYSSSVYLAIEYALQNGRICVASAGNDEWTIPGVRYPAAYNFGVDGQVIAVSGTELDNGTEQFIDGFNYSPGTDPINDPTNAFIDCSAPGTNYRALSGSSSTGTVHIWSGTSISAPFVSALVGLMLSVDSTLTPPEIYDIIKNTTDKIGQYSYDASGWNRYLGYGRIDAANAVNVATGAPAKPRNLQLTVFQNHPKLTWDANTETDLAGYNIYRSENGYTPQQIGYVAIPGRRLFIDYSANTSIPEDNYDYTIKAKDNTGLLSVPSNMVSIMALAPKISVDLDEEMPLVYNLEANYPNPFNPTTGIEYQLAKNSYVTLGVYNMLGEEVAELVNGFQESGYYSVQFDASNLPSGMYLYQIQAGEFFDVKKMLLLK